MFYPNEKVLSDLLSKDSPTPCYLTSEDILKKKFNDFKEAFPTEFKVYYAIKANYNPYIVKLLKQHGLHGVDVTSPGELDMAFHCGFNKDNITFTGNNVSDDDMRYVYSKGVTQNIGSISELNRFGKMFPGSDVSIRLNPGVGDGENIHVITSGEESKFGIKLTEYTTMKQIIDTHKLSVIGLHCHIGSGFYTTENFKHAINNILNEAKKFDTIEFVDFGGGFGVQYNPEKKPINLKDFYISIKNDIDAFLKNKPNTTFVFEPGKYLVAESTCLLATVNTIQNNGKVPFLGVNSGMNHLIRPALYNSYHHILNLTSKSTKKVIYHVVGNICESTDTFAENRELPESNEGDVIAFLTAGGYGASMSSLYNLRPYAKEYILLSDGTLKLTRDTPSLIETLKGAGFV